MSLPISGSKVRELMHTAGLNPTLLSQRTGLSPSTIDRVLNNRASNYSEFTLHQLANALGCSVFDLYTDEAIATGLADSDASAMTNVVVVTVPDAASTSADDASQLATPEVVAQAIQEITSTATPPLDVPAYFTYIQESHKAELENLRASYSDHIAELKREKRLWCVLSVVLIAAFVLWTILHL